MKLDDPERAAGYWRRKAMIRQRIIKELRASLAPQQTPPGALTRREWQSLAKTRQRIIEELRGHIEYLETRITELEGENQ